MISLNREDQRVLIEALTKHAAFKAREQAYLEGAMQLQAAKDRERCERLARLLGLVTTPEEEDTRDV